MGEMDKTYSNGEMVDMLLENPKREAFFIDKFMEHRIICNKRGEIVWKNNDLTIHFSTVHKDRRWTIIESPKKLKEMSFGEVMYYWAELNELDSNSFVSCVTGKSISRVWSEITKEEYMGFWTVEGIYEYD